MMNEDIENPPWSSFLIDLDLGIKETRREASGATGKTGIRTFMATGALFGEQLSLMHDLESIFWVLSRSAFTLMDNSGKGCSTFLQMWQRGNGRLGQIEIGHCGDKANFHKDSYRYFHFLFWAVYFIGEQAPGNCLPERQIVRRARRKALLSNERETPGGRRGLDSMSKCDGRDTDLAHYQKSSYTN